MIVFLPAPIYKVKYVRDHIQIWVLASTRALLEKKKKKKKEKKKFEKKKNCPRHYLAGSF